MMDWRRACDCSPRNSPRHYDSCSFSKSIKASRRGRPCGFGRFPLSGHLVGSAVVHPGASPACQCQSKIAGFEGRLGFRSDVRWKPVRVACRTRRSRAESGDRSSNGRRKRRSARLLPTRCQPASLGTPKWSLDARLSRPRSFKPQAKAAHCSIRTTRFSHKSERK